MPSKIEWTDETWSPVTGCSKVSTGCAHCYAERNAKRLAGRYGYPKEKPFAVTQHPDRLDQPAKWKRPRRVFACSMGDLFHKKVPWRFINAVFSTIIACPEHTFQVLTKRPERAAEQYDNLPWPKNLWFGVSVENQEAANDRMPWLVNCPAPVRFVSAEPLLEDINLTPWLDATHWVVLGCESGPMRRPCKREWMLSLVGQAAMHEVPLFVKQVDINGYVSKDPGQWHRDLQYQEWPGGVV